MPSLPSAFLIAVALSAMPHGTDAGTAPVRWLRPSLTYTLRVDTTDLSAMFVEINAEGAREPFRLGMFAHSEYDDKWWRRVERLRAESNGTELAVTREDSALWRVALPARDAAAPAQGAPLTVRYRVRFPSADVQRFAHQPFLTRTGGLLGGLHAFLYVLGADSVAARVNLDVPPSWRVATALPSSAGAHSFVAANVRALVESPMLVGAIREWRFTAHGVPQRIAYWPLPDATPFDTTAFLGDIERTANQAMALFVRAPFVGYTFLFEDGVDGALEHPDNLVLGVRSARLARNPHAYAQSIAHEYVHAWNLMALRPREFAHVDYRPPRPSRVVWFGEGITMFFADLLLRRAGIAADAPTRVEHLERLIERYEADPGNSRLSAERVSEVAFSAVPGAIPGALGDVSASTHLQGELIGAMLDFQIRDASGGTRSLDDLMRAMMERHAGPDGYGPEDIERTAKQLCGCDVSALFEGQVRRGRAIDFNRYLALAGLESRVTWAKAVTASGADVPDTRVGAWLPPGESRLSLLIRNTDGTWARAGLHTGDRIGTVNGAAMTTAVQFRQMLGKLALGDTVSMEVERGVGGAHLTVKVAVGGYDAPSAHIQVLDGAPDKARTIRARWAEGR